MGAYSAANRFMDSAAAYAFLGQLVDDHVSQRKSPEIGKHGQQKQAWLGGGHDSIGVVSAACVDVRNLLYVVNWDDWDFEYGKEQVAPDAFAKLKSLSIAPHAGVRSMLRILGTQTPGQYVVSPRGQMDQRAREWLQIEFILTPS